jgi:hypothetical protein
VAEVAAMVVGDPNHHYATYELCGRDFRNARELAQIIWAESGQEVTASHVPFPEPANGGTRPSEEEDHRHDAMFRLFDHYGRYGITGNPNVLRWLLGRPPTSFAEYVRRSLASR